MLGNYAKYNTGAIWRGSFVGVGFGLQRFLARLESCYRGYLVEYWLEMDNDSIDENPLFTGDQKF